MESGLSGGTINFAIASQSVVQAPLVVLEAVLGVFHKGYLWDPWTSAAKQREQEWDTTNIGRRFGSAGRAPELYVLFNDCKAPWLSVFNRGKAGSKSFK